jgi:glucosylceramidase
MNLIKHMAFTSNIILLVLTTSCSLFSCSKSKQLEETPVQVWITNPGMTALLWKTNAETITENTDNLPVIKIDPTQRYQTIDGFGYTLTGGSATLINQMSAPEKTNLLQELFGKSDNAIGISYLRISIGASDLSASVFTYDDLPDGQTDETLQQFNLSKDTVDLVPLLKEILAINPNIKIMGSPWTAPLWMKSNNNSVGGDLKIQNYGHYAAYFVRYIQEMKARGITIDAVTPQNEPQHGGNNPSMVMSATQQANFIKNHLGPAFKNAGITTKVIVWDHNCDNPGFPIAILDDPAANLFVDGAAFHLYNGDISALSQVHDAFPSKNLYFTEQWTGSTGTFAGDLKWHVKNVMIGSMRNWSKVALEWNLANDPEYKPHTPGGCSQCKGALTIDGNHFTRNVSYYIIAHLSKFVPAGSVRISSNISGQLSNVAFETPEGKFVLVVLNESDQPAKFLIKIKDKTIGTTLSAGSTGTFVF